MTNPTADAAKLLPCPFCGSIPVVFRHPAVASLWSIQCTSRDCDVRPSSPYLETTEATAAKWNTRPQPAPPEGEPDFDIMNGELEQEFYRTGGDRTHGYIRRYLVTRAYRLGLAARPKVEDAEVAEAVKHLRNRSEHLDYGNGDVRDEVPRELIAIADLLERLAGELAEARRIEWERCDALAGEIAALRNDLEEQDRAAESALAEREAELAKADAVIERRERQWLALADGHSPTFPNDHVIDEYETEAVARHAARQQQRVSADER